MASNVIRNGIGFYNWERKIWNTWGQSINQSILYLDTCRPGARKLVRNTNVGYKILHGKIYIKIRKQYKRNLAIITSQKLYIHYE